MNVCILNNNLKIQQLLQNYLPNYNIKVSPTAEQFYNYITHTAIIADIFVVMDNGIIDGSDTDASLNTGFSYLRRILDYDYFEPKTILFLNKTVNQEHKDKYNFLIATLRNKGFTNANLITKDVIELNDLYDAITSSSGGFYTKTLNRKAVIQKRKNSQVFDAKILSVSDNNDTVIVSLNMSQNKDIVKETLGNNTTKIDLSEEDNLKPIEEIPTEPNLTLAIEEEKKHVKYISVTGQGGCGASTTALTLALNGAQSSRTLLIDASKHLGLSYLVENVVPEGKRLEVSLERVISEKDNYIQSLLDNTNDDLNLHVMSITLPTIRAIGSGAMEYVILNLLSLIEDYYRYIIIDLPANLIEQYSVILGKSDLIIASCPPYLDKVVSTLSHIKESEIIQNTKAYKDNLLMFYLTGQPNLNGYTAITIREFKVYCENFLGKILNCTNPFICTKQQYIDQGRFRALLDRADLILNKEELI